MRWLLGAVLIAHGWVHGVMWALSFSDEAVADLPMNPAHSWLLGDSRAFAVGLALATAAVLIVAGIVRLTDAGWWPWVAIAGAALSVVILSLYFSPWWLFGFLINGSIIFLAWRALTDS